MKKHFRFPAVALLACVFDPAQFSIDTAKLMTDANHAIFCSAPYEYICGKNGATKARRTANFKKVTADAQKIALARVAKYLETDPATFTQEKYESLRLPRSYFAKSLYTIAFNGAIEVHVKKTELDAVTGNIGTVKDYLYKAIDAESAKGSLSLKQATRMKKKVRDTKVFTSFNLEVLKETSPETADGVLASYWKICGADGMSENAYSSSTVNDEPYIIMCPGWLLRATGGGSDTKNNFRNLIEAMGHEFGHKIDSNSGPLDTYSEFSECLAEHHADTLAPRSQVRAMYRKTVSKKYLNDYIVETHLPEITAEFWGERTLLEYLKTLPMDQRLEALRESYGGTCGAVDVGVHANDRWWIEVTLRRDPDFASEMGCPLPGEHGKPGCTLSGETSQNIY